MDVVSFLIQGSASNPYIVRFSRLANGISSKCTCPAGLKGQVCKHRLRILNGSSENILSGNIDQVAVVLSWLPGLEIEAALLEVERLELEFSQIKTKLSIAKKKLAKEMAPDDN